MFGKKWTGVFKKLRHMEHVKIYFTVGQPFIAIPTIGILRFLSWLYQV